MQQVAIEEDDGAGFYLNWNRIFVRERELISFTRAVETPIVVFLLWPDDAGNASVGKPQWV